ncbi:MAG: hypothetical protein HXM76_05050 [Mogibacterium diversum]|nr:hypothetical protein [Mogibacterium diversum]
MKWFLIEFWHFVTTSNVLGVVFGLAIGTLWKRVGKVEIQHVSDSELFSEDELRRVKKEDENSVLINIFNQKSVDVFILCFELEHNGKRYKARRRKRTGQSDIDALKVAANSVRTITLLCEIIPQKGDIVRATMHKRRTPLVFKIK